MRLFRFPRLLIRPAFVAGVALLVLASAGADPAPVRAEAFVTITDVTYEKPRHSLVLDISGPVTISTRSLKAPARLVVDVPTATLKTANRELVVGDALVHRVRISQYQIIPPVVRVVIETASKDEPLIAVQQTAKKLYITLAPARAHDGGDDGHGHAATPAPVPTATPLPVAPVKATPAPAATRTPVVVKTPPPTPKPAPTPRPVATPVRTPSPIRLVPPSLRPKPAPSGEKRGEAGHETLPILPD